MIRVTLAALLGLLGASVAAWQLGGALGAGVMAGFLLGAGFTGLGILYQVHIIRTRPERAMQAMVVSLLSKLVVVMVGALAFRYIEEVAVRADWRSFLATFALAVALLVPIGAWDATRILRDRRPA